MAKLTTRQRSRMPKSEFAGPGHSFPVNDPTHARVAISGATRSFDAGNISASEEDKIKAKARAKLGKSKRSLAQRVTAAAKAHSEFGYKG